MLIQHAMLLIYSAIQCGLSILKQVFWVNVVLKLYFLFLYLYNTNIYIFYSLFVLVMSKFASLQNFINWWMNISILRAGTLRI